MEESMDDLKQINLSEPSINEESQMEDRLMEPTQKSKTMPMIISAGVVLGLVAGFFIAQKQLLLANGGVSLTSQATQELTSATNVKVGDVFGSADEKTFRDQAEGILMAGGIDGEGSHHIERGANKSQWVYITSSVVDLDLLVGHKVTIWGETNQGKKAGWLMDVGRLKVQELNAAPANESMENE
jgi:hypothetical protein